MPGIVIATISRSFASNQEMSTITFPAGVTGLVAHRWSPRAFLDRNIEAEDLHGLFEAARWAASCFNEQPWRFVTATKADPATFARVLGLLVEKNREWAKTAYMLGFSVGKKTFTHNGTPDRYGLHDTGASMANLAIEATARGIHAHFMAGFDIVRARAEFGVPEDFEIGAAFAIGYVEESAEPGSRMRKPLAELVFHGEWGKTADFVRT